MSHENEILELFNIVKLSFNNAIEKPDLARWESCAQLAGVASVRVGVEGDIFRAAALEGVALEARRRLKELEAA